MCIYIGYKKEQKIQVHVHTMKKIYNNCLGKWISKLKHLAQEYQNKKIIF